MNHTRRDYRQEQHHKPFPKTGEKLLEFANKGSDTGLIIDEIKEFVRHNGKSISSSQLRNIYGKVVSIDDVDITGIQLLRPKLAYVAARQDKQDARIFVEYIDELISKINNESHVKSFKIFMEAIVAYHKFYAKSK
ncbi:MAG: type III-A CRISPR-associated protein Csm2 [Bacteroidales bacterium]|nr:type III-A CRISPR-associated protein Csm2 [Bacteroidales bacterium]